MSIRLTDWIYIDTGCEASDKCLKCPLTMCKYDDPEAYRRMKRERQDEEILAIMKKEKLTIKQTADRSGLNERTIYRIKARSKKRAKIQNPQGG